MAQKWNLQDIRPAGATKAPKPSATASQKSKQDIAPKQPTQQKRIPRDPDLASIDIIDGGSRKKKRIFISILFAVLILGAGYFVNTLLSGAEITVYPKFKDATVQATFTSSLEPQVDELGHELLILEANGERQVSATGQEEVSERAEGTIFIYNEFSSASQRLIKNTRFESPDGLIYRISESVEVPGRTEDNEGNIVPGVITAEVFADGTGEQYNIGPSRFTIPGLAGSEQFNSMYAESTDSLSGGFEGSRFIIEEGELQTAKQALHLELRDALITRIADEAPAGFILFPDAITFTFESLPSTEYGDQLATIKERAKLQVPLFKESQFSEFLAQSTIAGYEGEKVLLDDPLGLIFSYPSSTSTELDLSSMTSIEFTLAGSSRITWQFDESALKADLANLSKTALPNVLSGYPAIERAEAVVRPFWTQSFPEEASEITITTIIDDNTQ